jgi:hydrogenase nickel incorporation protein HypA/HybF
VHELAIARNIVNIAVAAAEREGAKKITRINVVAGELRGVVPEQLIFSFGLMAENTIASGAYLNLEIIPVVCRCRECNDGFTVTDYNYLCSKCQSKDLEVLSGTELRVKDIEVE